MFLRMNTDSIPNLLLNNLSEFFDCGSVSQGTPKADNEATSIRSHEWYTICRITLLSVMMLALGGLQAYKGQACCSTSEPSNRPLIMHLNFVAFIVALATISKAQAGCVTILDGSFCPVGYNVCGPRSIGQTKCCPVSGMYHFIGLSWDSCAADHTDLWVVIKPWKWNVLHSEWGLVFMVRGLHRVYPTWRRNVDRMAPNAGIVNVMGALSHSVQPRNLVRTGIHKSTRNHLLNLERAWRPRN
ncbi:hypothetical protein FB451DRAFT_1163772 [Mycena latifolia]|nr:hypothetical protein FB451DRAFT_1163772 [Mycena latifolia]